MLLYALTLVVLTLPAIANAEFGDMVLTVPALDSQITLRTSAQFAGAVSSLNFRGKEHIDSRDHGRLLQSAVSFDGLGECYNPTEGGAARNSNNERASILKAANIEGNQIQTTTAMAFFLGPNQAYPRGCGSKKYLKKAVNTVETSNYILEKKLTIGLPRFPNVIEHHVIFHVPEHFSHGVFEASTAYVPKDFSGAIYYDISKGLEVDPGLGQGEQIFPVILFTPDKRYAIGVYSPELPQKDMKVGYGRFSFVDVNKWNCVFRESNVKPGPYEYRCFIILGTLSEVEDTMSRLNETYSNK